MTITVVNTRATREGEYIGRGSPLGNPYHISNAAGRDDVCDAYEKWLTAAIVNNVPTVAQELDRLQELAKRGPLKLRCFCAPLRCHGDRIKFVLECRVLPVPRVL